MPRKAALKRKTRNKISDLELAQENHSSKKSIFGGLRLVLPGLPGNATTVPLRSKAAALQSAPLVKGESERPLNAGASGRAAHALSSWTQWLSLDQNVTENNENQPSPREEVQKPSQKSKLQPRSVTKHNETRKILAAKQGPHASKKDPPTERQNLVLSDQRFDLNPTTVMNKRTITENSQDVKRAHLNSDGKDAKPSSRLHHDNLLAPSLTEYEYYQQRSALRGRLGIEERIDVFEPKIQAQHKYIDDLESLPLRRMASSGEDDTTTRASTLATSPSKSMIVPSIVSQSTVNESILFNPQNGPAWQQNVHNSDASGSMMTINVEKEGLTSFGDEDVRNAYDIPASNGLSETEDIDRLLAILDHMTHDTTSANMVGMSENVSNGPHHVPLRQKCPRKMRPPTPSKMRDSEPSISFDSRSVEKLKSEAFDVFDEEEDEMVENTFHAPPPERLHSSTLSKSPHHTSLRIERRNDSYSEETYRQVNMPNAGKARIGNDRDEPQVKQSSLPKESARVMKTASQAEFHPIPTKTQTKSVNIEKERKADNNFPANWTIFGDNEVDTAYDIPASIELSETEDIDRLLAILEHMSPDATNTNMIDITGNRSNGPHHVPMRHKSPRSPVPHSPMGDSELSISFDDTFFEKMKGEAFAAFDDDENEMIENPHHSPFVEERLHSSSLSESPRHTLRIDRQNDIVQKPESGSRIRHPENDVSVAKDYQNNVNHLPFTKNARSVPTSSQSNNFKQNQSFEREEERTLHVVRQKPKQFGHSSNENTSAPLSSEILGDESYQASSSVIRHDVERTIVSTMYTDKNSVHNTFRPIENMKKKCHYDDGRNVPRREEMQIDSRETLSGFFVEQPSPPFIENDQTPVPFSKNDFTVKSFHSQPQTFQSHQNNSFQNYHSNSDLYDDSANLIVRGEDRPLILDAANESYSRIKEPAFDTNDHTTASNFKTFQHISQDTCMNTNNFTKMDGCPANDTGHTSFTMGMKSAGVSNDRKNTLTDQYTLQSSCLKCREKTTADVIEKRGYASPPIRNYWREYSNVRTGGSFDSISLKNDRSEETTICDSIAQQTSLVSNTLEESNSFIEKYSDQRGDEKRQKNDFCEENTICNSIPKHTALVSNTMKESSHVDKYLDQTVYEKNHASTYKTTIPNNRSFQSCPPSTATYYQKNNSRITDVFEPIPAGKLHINRSFSQSSPLKKKAVSSSDNYMSSSPAKNKYRMKETVNSPETEFMNFSTASQRATEEFNSRVQRAISPVKSVSEKLHDRKVTDDAKITPMSRYKQHSNDAANRVITIGSKNVTNAPDYQNQSVSLMVHGHNVRSKLPPREKNAAESDFAKYVLATSLPQPPSLQRDCSSFDSDNAIADDLVEVLSMASSEEIRGGGVPKIRPRKNIPSAVKSHRPIIPILPPFPPKIQSKFSDTVANKESFEGTSCITEPNDVLDRVQRTILPKPDESWKNSVFSKDLPSPLRHRLIHAMSPLLSDDIDEDSLSDWSSRYDPSRTGVSEVTNAQCCTILSCFDFGTLEERLRALCRYDQK